MLWLLLQGQAQAARKRAAGTMDQYTFIAEDAETTDQAGSLPALQPVSAEELYKNELAQEMQVHSACMHDIHHISGAAPSKIQCVLWSKLLCRTGSVLQDVPHCRTHCECMQAFLTV